MNDDFTTIRAEVRGEVRVRGSRFLALAAPVTRKEDVAESLAKIQREYYDATHHCYAYRLGPAGHEFRFADAGEPAGTAGKPIYAVIEGKGLTDILVIVTRYFGGTKLGIGGLTHAYADAARCVLEKADRVTRYMVDMLELSFPHALTGNVMHIVSQNGLHIVDSVYDELVHLRIEVRRSHTDAIRSLLYGATRGNITVKQRGLP
jgi:uncharacterized YigZ family protein